MIPLLRGTSSGQTPGDKVGWRRPRAGAAGGRSGCSERSVPAGEAESLCSRLRATAHSNANGLNSTQNVDRMVSVVLYLFTTIKNIIWSQNMFKWKKNIVYSYISPTYLMSKWSMRNFKSSTVNLMNIYCPIVWPHALNLE